MKINNIHYSIKDNKSILSAQIVLNSGKKHDIYFEVNKEFKDFISKDASPFLSAALPISMKKRENLVIDGTVSNSLISNTPEIMNILKSWNLGFNPITIKAKIIKKDLEKSNITGCFFSGGVDSFYTYIKNKNKINYLIFVHGFDINTNALDLYKKIEKNISEIAKKEKVKLIRIKTNIRDTFEQYFDWDMSHVFALASVSLFLRYGFKEIYMSCGQTDINAPHRYMSPDIDNLWSTEHMKINHYGCSADKIIKLKFLSNNKLAMENLRVCWMNKKNEYNCCECEKCFRNMLALYASDSLEKCRTFNKGIDLDKLKNTRINTYCLKYFTTTLKALKFKNDTSNVRFALEECIKNNKYPNVQKRLIGSIRDFIRVLDKTYNRNRLFWYLSSKDLI